MAVSIEEHLNAYGIKRCRGRGDYVSLLRSQMSEEQIREFEYMQRFFSNEPDRPTDARATFDYYALKHRYGPFWSQTAGFVIEAGKAISDAIAGRMRVLDLGCHVGHLTSWYGRVDQARRITGVDFAPEAVVTARRVAQTLGIKNVDFQECDLTQCNLGGIFDAIVDLRTLLYIPNLQQCLVHLVSRLIPGGILVSVPPSPRHAEVLLVCLQNFGLRPMAAEIRTYHNFGEAKAFPIIVAISEPPRIDLRRLYERMNVACALMSKGLGCKITGDSWYVSEVLPDSPAAQAGARLGDQITLQPGQNRAAAMASAPCSPVGEGTHAGAA